MSEKEFFEKISLDNDGNVNVVIVSKNTPSEKGVNRYNTFKKIELTPEGYLRVYEA